MKTLFPTQPALEPTMEAALARIGDDGGLTEDESGTLSLSTPIVSTQDGPRMSGVSNIPAHRKAAPFRKGGKRRKAVLAKDALRKSKSGDYSNLDLAFNPAEKRDKYGKWTNLDSSLTALKPGDKVSFSDSHGGNASTFVAIKDGQFRHDDGIKVGPNSAGTYHGLELDVRAKEHQAKGGRVQVFRRRHLGNLALTAESQRDIDLGGRHSVENEPRGRDGKWIAAAGAATTRKDIKRVTAGAFHDYQDEHTLSHEAWGQVSDILGAKMGALNLERQGTVLTTGPKGITAVPDPKRKTALGRLLHQKHEPQSKELRKALGLPKGYDPRSTSFSTPEGGEVDLGFLSSEKRDGKGRWATGGPTYMPEKGPRGPAEAKYLAAKNMLAKAVLSQDDHAIKKYQGKVAQHRAAFDQERNASAAVARAGKVYGSAAHVAATAGSSNVAKKKSFLKSIAATMDAMNGLGG